MTKITANVGMNACDAYLTEILSSNDHVKAIRAAIESTDAIISLGTIPEGVIVTQDLLRSMLSDTKTKD